MRLDVLSRIYKNRDEIVKHHKTDLSDMASKYRYLAVAPLLNLSNRSRVTCHVFEAKDGVSRAGWVIISQKGFILDIDNATQVQKVKCRCIVGETHLFISDYFEFFMRDDAYTESTVEPFSMPIKAMAVSESRKASRLG
ncbi:hypothetical protein CSIM01_08493 [Colletotrichum simmondsii]|uniref:Uncharacterized protein n=1 Tax=Colletotrichum simmondsii TaxID=703756 RepID=A0A135SY45_9PEZI|nr:hypothetical protein CSIM01_08493 [Colletotrichum simmondsii]